jgi:thioredoxin 2
MNSETIIVRCKTCGTKNRIPGRRVNEGPLCGKCRAPLGISRGADKPVKVTDQSFQAQVLSEPGAVLVDCWAPWCGPCRMVGPVLDELASEYAGRIKIAKLNVDENPKTASQYGVRSIPTLLFFQGGKLVDTRIGALPKQEIESRLRGIL